MSKSLLLPDWPAPERVRAYTTTRLGGCSEPPFDSFNLGDHVGDRAECVEQNRKTLAHVAGLPEFPTWLEQVHGTRVLDLDHATGGLQADAALSRTAGRVCVVMTADCLPVLFCNRAGTVVAAAHAGWRGLCDGVLEATVAAMRCPADQILAWIGPAIGPTQFEVGSEVREAFIRIDEQAGEAFGSNAQGRWQADLPKLAVQRLAKCGVTACFGGDFCTFTDSTRFYSYRRDGQTGRMASIIWLDNTP